MSHITQPTAPGPEWSAKNDVRLQLRETRGDERLGLNCQLGEVDPPRDLGFSPAKQVSDVVHLAEQVAETVVGELADQRDDVWGQRHG
jgi:hypothetical protein